MISRAVGKSKIKIEVKGCISCGTDYSTGWTSAKTVPVKIGHGTVHVSIPCCADCCQSRKKKQ